VASIKELARRFGVDRNTVRRALRSQAPPRYERPARPSKLDPFKEEIHELLRGDPKLPGVRVRELIEPLGFDGLWSLGALARLMVRDREGCLHAGGGRPTDVYAAFCGQLLLDWYFCEAKDPQAKGGVARLQEYFETNFEPGRRFANHLDFQLQLDAWFEKANGRLHRTLSARPVDRLAEERSAMRALPEREPDSDRRWVMRVPPDPYLRFDTNDYSLEPKLVGRRVEIRVCQHQITAVALDTGELACQHERCFAKNRTIRRSSTPARRRSAAASAPGRSLSSSGRLLSMTIA
jgi:hypothetical protein